MQVVITTVAPLIFSLIVIYLNNRHSRKLKQLEVELSLQKLLFEKKLVVFEQGFIKINMISSLISNAIIVYESVIEDTLAGGQLLSKIDYLNLLQNKINSDLDSIFLIDLYLEYSPNLSQETAKLTIDLFSKQSELENIANERNDLFNKYIQSKYQEDYIAFKSAIAKERNEVKNLVELLASLALLNAELKELMKKEIKKISSQGEKSED